MADARLAGLDNPIYIGLRQHIADARQALAETAVPNTVAISAEIDAIQSRLSGLRFEEESRLSGEVPAEATATEQGWWARLKASLASLVTVRRNAADAASRLTFEDKDLLRQGLWMQFESARLAMMRQDEIAWAEALARVDSALDRWFDDTTAEYRTVREGLEALSKHRIAPALPDISGPWAQLQLIRQARAASATPSQTRVETSPQEIPADDAVVDQQSAEDDPAADDSQ